MLFIWKLENIHCEPSFIIPFSLWHNYWHDFSQICFLPFLILSRSHCILWFDSYLEWTHCGPSRNALSGLCHNHPLTNTELVQNAVGDVKGEIKYTYMETLPWSWSCRKWAVWFIRKDVRWRSMLFIRYGQKTLPIKIKCSYSVFGFKKKNLLQEHPSSLLSPRLFHFLCVYLKERLLWHINWPRTVFLNDSNKLQQ